MRSLVFHRVKMTKEILYLAFCIRMQDRSQSDRLSGKAGTENG